MHNVASPAMDDASLEPRLAAAAKAPRVTKDELEANIVHINYVTYVAPSGQLLRWCVLTTRSGFAVTGDPSAAVSPENDDPAIGERLAYENARNKLWQHMGYALKESIYLAEHATEVIVLDPQAIARVCHEVNRAYCEAIGDTSQPVWEQAPEWQRDSAIKGVMLHLTNPLAGPQASHESWMAEKEAAGWKYGAVKNPDAKERPCMVPFSDLPREQQAKDFIFRAVVHALGHRP